jgi:hypothetical protein
MSTGAKSINFRRLAYCIVSFWGNDSQFGRSKSNHKGCEASCLFSDSDYNQSQPLQAKGTAQCS